MGWIDHKRLNETRTVNYKVIILLKSISIYVRIMKIHFQHHVSFELNEKSESHRTNKV